MWRASRRENGNLLQVIVLVDKALNKQSSGSGNALHKGFDFIFGVLAIWGVEMAFYRYRAPWVVASSQCVGFWKSHVLRQDYSLQGVPP